MTESMFLIPAEQGVDLPARFKNRKVTNHFAAVVGGGYKVLSIKSKVFTIVDGDQKTLLTKPGEDDTPAASINVVILAANPNKSKVYYANGYVEGSTDKPTCYSNNGVKPEADAIEPQSKTCAACPHNVFGSRVTENGKKGKACSDSLRLAVAAPDRLDDPMLLRVPATSLSTLGSYGAELAARGAEPHDVVTRIGFDYSVSHPALTFRIAGFIPDQFVTKINRARENPVIAQIIGTAPTEVDDDRLETTAAESKPAVEPVSSKSVTAKGVAKPAPAKAPALEKPKAAPKQEATVSATEEASEPLATIDDLDFDD